MKILSGILIIGIYVLLYGDEQGDSSILQLDTLEITAKTTEKDVITIADKETEIGQYADVNKIIFMNPGVNRVPESGSQLLINCGSIYDNHFFLNEVPMFVPAHFSGHSFLDVSNILVPSLQSFKLVTSDIPGNYAGFSNGVILVEPGIFRVDRKLWRLRPQVLLTLGTYDAGLCVSTSLRKGKDQFQITANVPNSYLIAHKNSGDNSYIWWDLSYYDDHTEPLWYEDITVSGKSEFQKVKLEEHLWLALDAYSSAGPAGKSIIPWGAGTISLEDVNQLSKWKVTTGGSHQYSKQRKILGTVVSESRVERSNASFFGEVNTINIGSFLFNCNLRGEFLSWKGDSWTYRKYGTSSHESIRNSEVNLTAHTGMQNGTNNFSYGIDILGGGMVYEDVSLFVDPGVWGRFLLDSGYISLVGGIQTSWPDIRGLPNKIYRTRQIKSYMGSVALQKDFTRFHFLQKVYIQWKDHCPAFSINPEELHWDSNQATPLLTGGISGEWSVDLFSIITLRLLHDFSSSRRRYNDAFTTYEWSIPWSLRPLVQFRLLQNRLNLYLTGIFTEGLPYQDLDQQGSVVFYVNGKKRMPPYKRIDMKLQFSQPIDDHRFFTSFTAYLDIFNVFDMFDRFTQKNSHYWENIREYYWNEYMVKKPVYLERSGVSLGMRASFRL